MLELAAQLPALWTAQPVRLERVAAPVLGADPWAPDTLAFAQGATVRVGLDGLPEALARWRLEHPDTAPPDVPTLVARQVAHALTHTLDHRMFWSRDLDFRDISGWRPWPWRGPAAEQDPLAYATPAGRTTPAEDLVTIADHLLFPLAPGPDAAPCRWPRKWRYLTAQTGHDPLPAPGCVRLDEVGLDPALVDEIDILYVVSTAQAASIGGHTLVAVRYAPDALGNRREEAWGLVADTTGVRDGGLRYLLLGLTGGFPARVVAEPLTTTALRYTEGEDRDLRLYRLVLDEDQERAALARLDELRQGWLRPYTFFNENCGRLPEELALAALDGDLARIRPLSPDALLAALGRQGLLEEAPSDRLAFWSTSARSMAARRLSRDVVREILAQNPATRQELRRVLRALDSPRSAERIAAYLYLRTTPLAVASRDPLLRLLAWRDPQEVGAWARERPAETPHAPNPALDPLRAAIAAVRGPGPPRAAELGDAALLEAMRVDRARASTHTPFRPIGLFGATMWTGDALWSGLSFSSALYEGQIGPGRRWPMSDNPSLKLLSEELVVGLGTGQLWSRTTVAQALYLPGTTLPLRAGLGFTLADLTLQRGGGRVFSATLAEGRGLVALSTSPRYQRDLRLSAGFNLRADGAPELALPPLHLSLPVGLEAELGSGRQQRTAIRVAAHGGPALALGKTSWWESTINANLGLRLLEVRGVDVILSAGLYGRLGLPGDPWAPREGRARAGVWLERY